jgi:ubiquitin C-terminal hydrolase
MVSLVRFKYEDGGLTKILRDISFGESMELTLQSKELVEYSLFAVIFHSGRSAAFGHYYCFAKENGAWQLFNDSMVQRATFSQITNTSREFPSECPYILCYRRTDSTKEDDAEGSVLPDSCVKYVV